VFLTPLGDSRLAFPAAAAAQFKKIQQSMSANLNERQREQLTLVLHCCFQNYSIKEIVSEAR